MSAATTLPPGAESAAHAVAEAEGAVARTSAVLIEATEKRNRISARIAVLQGERAAIVSRRQQDQGEDDDGARLALLGADLEGLAALLLDAEAVVTHAQAPHQRAQQTLESARYMIATMQAHAEQEALVEFLDTLQQRALEGLARLHVLHGQGRPAWFPSREFFQALRSLAAQGGAL